jgi:hypothetical protein
MKPEYDFKTMRKADPARHRVILARGTNVAKVNHDDGSSSTVALEPDPRALLVRLEPDVAKAFPTAESVNEGLRLLIRASELQHKKAS